MSAENKELYLWHFKSKKQKNTVNQCQNHFSTSDEMQGKNYFFGLGLNCKFKKCLNFRIKDLSGMILWHIILPPCPLIWLFRMLEKNYLQWYLSGTLFHGLFLLMEIRLLIPPIGFGAKKVLDSFAPGPFALGWFAP